ncbi:MAG: hypothetical protein ACPL3S_03575 [Halothiobacillaceae bacterium]
MGATRSGRRGGFFWGIWLGAGLVAYPLALVLLYLLTGQVFVPSKKGPRRVAPEQILADWRAWLSRVREGKHA